LVCFEGIVKFEELKSNDMKAKYLIAAAASLMIALATSCGNAGAQNDNNKKATGPKHAIELTSEQFSQLVYDIDGDDMKYLGSKPAIVDFTATWCGPCRSIAPILEELAKEYEGQIVVYKVDVDKCRDVATAFGISSIPAVLYIPLDGEPSMTIGARNKSKFQNEIDKILLGK
jgi:thioredoxin